MGVLPGSPAGHGVAKEFEQEERIAAGEVEDLRDHGGVGRSRGLGGDQRRGVFVVKGGQVDRRGDTSAFEPCDPAGEHRARQFGPVGENHEEAPTAADSREMQNHLDRRIVREVSVVDDQRDP